MNNFYEKIGGFWYENIGNFWFPRQHRKLVSFVQSRPKLRILDVGCGTGSMLRIIADKFPDSDLYGIDFAQSMIDFAKKKNPDFKFSVASAESLPFEDKKFDVITNSNSFHHYLNPDRAVKEVYRVLNSSGQILLMDTMPKTNKQRKIFDFIAKNILRDGHVGYRTVDEIVDMLRKCGFKNIVCENISFPKVVVISGFKN